MPEDFPLIDVTCPMLADDVHLAGMLAESLGISVPQVFSLAVRLLESCHSEHVLRSDCDSNFIIARCRQRNGLPDVYHRIHF